MGTPSSLCVFPKAAEMFDFMSPVLGFKMFGVVPAGLEMLLSQR